MHRSSEVLFDRIPSVRSLPIIVSSRKFLKNIINILHLPSYHQNVIPIVSGPEMSLIISPVDFGKFFMKPSGFWRTLVKCFTKPSGFSQMFIESRVDSRKPLQKPSDFSQTFYPKPSGFSQMFIKVEWILANVYQSRVDSRKCLSKPSGFSQILC